MLLGNKPNVDSGPGWIAGGDISVCTVIASVGLFQQTSLPPSCRFLVEFNLYSWWNSDLTAKGRNAACPLSSKHTL